MSEEKYKSLRDILDAIVDINGLGSIVELAEVLGVSTCAPYHWLRKGLPKGRVDQLFLLGKQEIPVAEIKRFVHESDVVLLDLDSLSEKSRDLFEKLYELRPEDESGRKTMKSLADAVGVTTVTLYNWIRDGEVTPAKARVMASLSKGKFKESDFNPVFAGLVRKKGVPDKVDADRFNEVGAILAQAARNIVAAEQRRKGGGRAPIGRINFSQVIAGLVDNEPSLIYKWSRTGAVPPAYCREIAEWAGVIPEKLNPVFAGMVPDKNEKAA